METQQPSSSSPFTYHIFLSFRGADTRKTFTDHLYTALCNAGFRTFQDDECLIRGEDIRTQIKRAIKESSISIVVFSKGYGSSAWCLDELVEILQRQNSVDDGYRVFPIFYDVEPTELGNQKGSFKEAFDKYEESGKHSKEKIDQWRKALKKVSKLAGKVLQAESNGHEAAFIQTIVKEAGIMLKQTGFFVDPYTVGVDSRVKDIDLWLKHPADVGIGVITGMRGIGKTTIAKVAYNLNFTDFDAKCFLSDIREASEQQNGLVELQSQLLLHISKRKNQKIYNTDEGIVKIQDAIYRKRILVILDDVDQIEQVDALIGLGDSLAKGSKIIITTSRERLLSHQKHRTFRIKQLDYQESLRLFCLNAFGQVHPMEGYREHSDRIVQHCEGLPLALKSMGNLLFLRDSESWARALKRLETIPDEQICKTLEVSYNSLDDEHDKRLFLMIAWSYVGIDIDDVVKRLEQEDFYSKIGVQNLLDQYLISVDKYNKIVMHHLVRGMARAIIRYGVTGAKTETVLLYKNDKSGKGKILDDFNEDIEVGSSWFQRLCLGCFS